MRLLECNFLMLQTLSQIILGLIFNLSSSPPIRSVLILPSEYFTKYHPNYVIRNALLTLILSGIYPDYHHIH